MPLPTAALQKGRVTCTDVVRCALDLGEQDVKVYESVNDLGAATTDDIARAVRRESSVVYRSLQRLVDCGIVSKSKRTLPEGGYYHLYAAAPKREVKARLKACVNDWHAQMTTAIDRL